MDFKGKQNILKNIQHIWMYLSKFISSISLQKHLKYDFSKIWFEIILYSQDFTKYAKFLSTFTQLLQ